MRNFPASISHCRRRRPDPAWRREKKGAKAESLLAARNASAKKKPKSERKIPMEILQQFFFLFSGFIFRFSGCTERMFVYLQLSHHMCVLRAYFIGQFTPRWEGSDSSLEFRAESRALTDPRATLIGQSKRLAPAPYLSLTHSGASLSRVEVKRALET